MDGLYLVSLSRSLPGRATKVVKVPANIHNKGLVLPRRKGGNNTTSSSSVNRVAHGSGRDRLQISLVGFFIHFEIAAKRYLPHPGSLHEVMQGGLPVSTDGRRRHITEAKSLNHARERGAEEKREEGGEFG